MSFPRGFSKELTPLFQIDFFVYFCLNQFWEKRKSKVGGKRDIIQGNKLLRALLREASQELVDVTLGQF